MKELSGEFLDKIQIGIVVIDRNKRVLFSNLHALRLLGKKGYTQETFCYEFLKCDNCPCDDCYLQDETGLIDICEIKPADTDEVIECIRTKLDSGSILVQLRDITSYRVLQSELDQAMISDSKSGLLKNSLIHDHLQREMSRARRFGTNIGLIMLRISDLAHPGVNSIPSIVTRILRGIGEILGNDLRAYDLAFRYDRDTFAVILPGEDLDSSLGVADRLYSKIKNLGIQRARVGVANMGSATSADDVIDAAKRALYVAEHSDQPISSI
ncbi:diguanylate cyclase [bacterium]|nr:diguanylate cyclase [bacterium]